VQEGLVKILLAYGSAMSRIDDMKLFGGVSGGRTGREILEAVVQSSEWEFKTNKDGRTTPITKDHDLRVLTNPWTKHPHWPGPTAKFRTWEEYRDKLYQECEEWRPDIVICAVAVSNYTPRFVTQTGKYTRTEVPCVAGKIDSRDFDRLLIEMEKTPSVIGGVRNRIGQDAVLVGFKLTSHGWKEAMLRHAEQVLTEAQCDLVIANDLKRGLENKWAVYPTSGDKLAVPIATEEILAEAIRIKKAKDSGYYRTVERAEIEPQLADIESAYGIEEAWEWATSAWANLGYAMNPHGTFALRLPDPPGGFVTTTRGKREVFRIRHAQGEGPLTFVWKVDHEKREVVVGHHQFSQEHATLNAPLLARIFQQSHSVQVILHLHRYLRSATHPYVPPATAAEVTYADKGLSANDGFNIEGHGSIKCFYHADLGKIMAFVQDGENWA
jgi:hypothetical protein